MNLIIQVSNNLIPKKQQYKNMCWMETQVQSN